MPPKAAQNKRASSSSTPKRASATPKKSFREKQGKPNQSILSFFKKVEEKEEDDGGLFFEESAVAQKWLGTEQEERESREAQKYGLEMEENVEVEEEDLFGDGEEVRFNEVEGSVKRQRTRSPDKKDGEGKDNCTPPPPQATRQPRRIGAFLDHSDSEDDDIAIHNTKAQKEKRDEAVAAEKNELDTEVAAQPRAANNIVETEPVDQNGIHENASVIPEVSSVTSINRPEKSVLSGLKSKPKLKHEATSSQSGAYDEIDDSDDSPLPQDDEDDDHAKDYADGEEMESRRWMLNQELKLFSRSNTNASNGLVIPKTLDGEEDIKKWDPGEWEGDWESDATVGMDGMGMDSMVVDSMRGEEGGLVDDGIVAACPICEASLKGVETGLAERHVNGCLDGNPIPLPSPSITPAISHKVKEEKVNTDGLKLERTDSSDTKPKHPSARFSQAAIARPGQANPFSLDTAAAANASGSAFSMLMSGKAEDAAWAVAAAAESAARGKPAYQRVCPFYKIMPGFFICVDAFRYGAVQGCNAYFLSHFHSDHYVGLSGSWCHGPIYASSITARLVVQQLKVDPKYVVVLNFGEKLEVPGTEGVYVTMIPANHCPGSSLFLFEKPMGDGPRARVQRVLHCGDFRACPEHIKHPKLMPDIIDSVSGKTKQQKIDVCYLDTTYMNPKYAFPEQEAVIRSCADMCVSLSKDKADSDDTWEKAKRERAGAGMAKFITIGKPVVSKEESESVAMTLDSSKPRGRLLVICGTYSIGKERICLGIARALDCKIWAPAGKRKICAALEDEELISRLTDDPLEAQIHMQMLMEIRAETLQDYLNTYKPHFSRIVGFRPSGWNYRPPKSRFVESPSIDTILHSTNWRSSFSMQELVPMRGSTREATCFGVPYSEHSSFRELTMFCCALRIEKIIPTVNIQSAVTRTKMQGWIERWQVERRKNGPIKFGEGKGEVKW